MVQAFNGIIHLSATGYTAFYNIIYHKNFVKLANLIISLSKNHFQKPTKDEQKSLFFYCFLKYLTAMYFMFMHIVTLFNNLKKGASFVILVTFSSGTVTNVLQSVMTIIFISITINTRFYLMLNSRLTELLNDISRFSRVSCLATLNQKLKDISILYTKVYRYQKYAFKIYQIQVWSVLVTNYVSCTVRAFQLYNHIRTGEFEYIPTLTIVLTTFTYIFDLFFFVQVCDENVEAWKDSKRVLRSFCFYEVDQQLQRGVSISLIIFSIFSPSFY